MFAGIIILQSKDFLEKPRPYTFQMGFRLSVGIKNKNMHVLDYAWFNMLCII